MGYTHRWEGKAHITDEVVEHIERIFEVAKINGVQIADDREGEDPPVVTSSVVLVAQVGDYDEDNAEDAFLLYGWRDPDYQGKCETLRKPYDEVVVAILVVLEEASQGQFTWTSDGSGADHAAGRVLARQAQPVAPTRW